VQYCEQSRFPPHCDRQDALLKTRRVYVEEAPSKIPSRTAPVAPPFFIVPPPRNHLAFSFPSTILGPTAHPRPSPSTSLSHLYHLPPTLPLAHLNNYSTLDSQPKRHASQMFPFLQQTRTCRGKPKATCTTPREGY